MLWQLLANGVVNGCVLALMSASFAFIYNTTRIFHIAHGGVYTVAAYLCYAFLIQMRLPLSVAILLALLLTALLGALVEYFLYAPLARRRASLSIALLSSLGLYVVLVNTVAMIWGNETKVLRSGVEATVQFGSVILTRIQIAQVIVAICLVSVFLWILQGTRWGRIMRAVRDNPTLTSVMGVNLYRVRVAVFAVGSALAAVAAILTALDVGMDPNVGMPMLLTAAVALIVGGVGSFGAPIAGAFLIALVQSLLIWKLSARWVDAFTFGFLIACLIARPQGLLAGKRRVEEAIE